MIRKTIFCITLVSLITLFIVVEPALANRPCRTISPPLLSGETWIVLQDETDPTVTESPTASPTYTATRTATPTSTATRTATSTSTITRTATSTSTTTRTTSPTRIFTSTPPPPSQTIVLLKTYTSTPAALSSPCGDMDFCTPQPFIPSPANTLAENSMQPSLTSLQQLTTTRTGSSIQPPSSDLREEKTPSNGLVFTSNSRFPAIGGIIAVILLAGLLLTVLRAIRARKP